MQIFQAKIRARATFFIPLTLRNPNLSSQYNLPFVLRLRLWSGWWWWQDAWLHCVSLASGPGSLLLLGPSLHLSHRHPLLPRLHTLPEVSGSAHFDWLFWLDIKLRKCRKHEILDFTWTTFHPWWCIKSKHSWSNLINFVKKFLVMVRRKKSMWNILVRIKV